MNQKDIDTQKIVDNIKESIEEREILLKELKEKYPIEDFVTYNEFNVSDRLKLLPMKIYDFQFLLNKEKARLEDLTDAADKINAELYDYYRFNYEKNLSPVEIKDYYLKNDSRMITINKYINKQKYTVAYFEGCLKALEKMSWTIKDFIKAMNS